jgi:hypothetical protein
MSTDKSPFVPGARVAEVYGYGDNRQFTERFVEKVYKTGYFVLRHDAQRRQWRPVFSRFHFTDESGQWKGIRTGREYSAKRHIVFWDLTVDAEIIDAIARRKRRQHWHQLVQRVMAIPHDSVTDAMCDALAKVLPEPEKTESTE